MASFSFGAGNARKIARLPLYALGRLVTAVTPRTDRWAFGCGAGLGDGPLELWRVAVDRGRDAVWLSDDEDELRDARARGMRAVRKSSFAGFWETARAGVLVVAYGFGDVNPYAVSGGFVAQLWHGVPLKRIGLDAPETVRSPLDDTRGPLRLLAPALRVALRGMYRTAARRIDLMPAASHLVRGRLESAFGLPDDRIVVTGEPRADVLSRGSDAERRAEGRALIRRLIPDLPADGRLVLYAPTWRDGEPDPAVPGAEDWRAIEDVMARNDAVLLVRSHRLGAGEYRPPADVGHVRALGADLLADVTPALAGVDVLVTDYSSLAYDVALVPLPVLFLAPDVAVYARRRGFYGRFEDVAGGDAAESWAALAPRLDRLLGDAEAAAEATARSAALSERVHAHRDGRSAERVYDAIVRRTETSPRKATR
ncbi:CDP-glycerol glycerophosphotransferase family protein [Microbacterium marinilacus]|uniref:CDP-glycerol glycerophosphotransferase family protein n=1 Tax=Microbacterium marinilacus TaxID=415209 RepID=A0ABP7B7C2_9MICO|nr:CDP-glycerol glycerophosphotransferase family protein [Microbacterium marinilacus]MBY0687540.1 CDP-glycerol glycerophosphotransferase family protein [Microbacterium marinilacus]